MSLVNLILGLIGLGIMVFIHELGHFVAAKVNRVAVEVFSLGWGPRMVGFTRGGTRYQISWFPIGGYCKMKGELAPTVAGGDGAPAPGGSESSQSQAPTHEEGSFLAAAPWRRIMIAVFGPLFNVIFAIIVFFIIWWAGFNIYSTDNRIILATDYTLNSFTSPTPATAAGMKTGDRITGIDGKTVVNFQDILESVSSAPGKTLHVTVVRDENGARRELQLSLAPQLDKDTGAGRIGIYAWVDPVVRSVKPGTAAAIAGLEKGDRIVAADGQPVRNTIDLEMALSKRPTRISLDVERSGRVSAFPLVLDYDSAGRTTIGLDWEYKVYRTPRLGPIGAVAKAGEETWSTTVLTVKGLGLLFQGINFRKAVSGPLGIANVIGDATTSGLAMGLGAGVVQAFRLLALLSIVLFLMNLLPIPAMDGGLIIIFLVEIIRGKPVQLRRMWQLQLVGFSLLMILFVFATFNDVMNLFKP